MDSTADSDFSVIHSDIYKKKNQHVFIFLSFLSQYNLIIPELSFVPVSIYWPSAMCWICYKQYEWLKVPTSCRTYSSGNNTDNIKNIIWY